MTRARSPVPILGFVRGLATGWLAGARSQSAVAIYEPPADGSLELVAVQNPTAHSTDTTWREP